MSKSSKPIHPAKPIGGGKKEYTIHGGKFIVDEVYNITKAVGTGAYGIVCSAEDTRTGEKVAIKKIGKVFDDLVDGKRILREIKLLSFLHHENIISIKDILRPLEKSTFEDIYFASELMDTDLHQIIRSKQKLTDEHHQYFIYQALRALKYIHSANILHRDLKPGNLLVNGNCDLLICDFGLARGYDKNELTDYVVTRWYRPPELLLLSNYYSPAVDIWSVGCILAELLNRKPLFPGRDYINQINIITDALGVPCEEDIEDIKSVEAIRYLRSIKRKPPIPMQTLIPSASVQALDLIEKMLAFNPVKRITAAEALAHPYLAQLHDPNDEPVCSRKFYWEKDSCDLSAEELRNGLWEEIERYHPTPPGEAGYDASKDKKDDKADDKDKK
ncbi:Extracellular signal-regulated kinase 1 [Diplonema papillatum]|nr:Extracellular signal-regulated kinase 1 [Diplonema papillatum]